MHFKRPNVANDGVIEANARLISTAGDTGVEFTQEITSEFLQELQDRFVGTSDPSGEMLCVASVPTAVAEKWLRQGFDIYKEPARAIVARLKAESLDRFVTTSKRI
jgi:hypothetical protein